MAATDRRIIGLIPAAGRASRLHGLDSSKEVVPVGTPPRPVAAWLINTEEPVESGIARHQQSVIDGSVVVTDIVNVTANQEVPVTEHPAAPVAADTQRLLRQTGQPVSRRIGSTEVRQTAGACWQSHGRNTDRDAARADRKTSLDSCARWPGTSRSTGACNQSSALWDRSN